MFDRINAYNCHKLLVWSVSELKLVEVFKKAKQINLRTDIKLIFILFICGVTLVTMNLIPQNDGLRFPRSCRQHRGSYRCGCP